MCLIISAFNLFILIIMQVITSQLLDEISECFVEKYNLHML